MAYDFKAVESKWHNVWQETKAYQVSEDESKQKYYVLDMFPYPSGAGLHVGHPLGYIASDIYSRYKRQKGDINFEKQCTKSYRFERIQNFYYFS